MEATFSENISFSTAVAGTNYSTCGGEKLHFRFYTVTQMITGLVLYPVTGLFGLLGNSLSLLVFSRTSMRTSTNVYLIALAVADTIKVVTDLLYFVVVLLLRVNPPEGERLHGHLYPYAHYSFNMSLLLSAWLTVSVAVERFIFICRPMRVKEFCTIGRAVRVCLAVSVLAVSISMPYMLRYTTFSAKLNDTVQYGVNVTALWSHESFTSVFTWTHTLLRSVFPLIILAYLNTSIWVGMRRPRSVKKKTRAKHRVTITLINVVLVFFVCVAPDAIMSSVLGLGYYEENYLARGFREITDYLLLVNSAVNFFIYFFCNTTFRNSLKSLLPCDTDYVPASQNDVGPHQKSVEAGTKPCKKNCESSFAATETT